ncbi:hypothetical protein, partial [Thauera linaloolentis]
VGHRQTNYPKTPDQKTLIGRFNVYAMKSKIPLRQGASRKRPEQPRLKTEKTKQKNISEKKASVASTLLAGL